MGDKKYFVSECPHLQYSRDEFQELGFKMVQFFWQDDLVSVFKFLCVCMEM